MYNHYIPQSDGSYRRSTIPEQNRKQQFPRGGIPNPNLTPNPAPAPDPPESTVQRGPQPTQQPSSPLSPQLHFQQTTAAQPLPPKSGGILSFLKGLLPREIDTDDLLIILLIMLMNRDDEEDDLSPMLTLALYFLL